MNPEDHKYEIDEKNKEMLVFDDLTIDFCHMITRWMKWDIHISTMFNVRSVLVNSQYPVVCLITRITESNINKEIYQSLNGLYYKVENKDNYKSFIWMYNIPITSWHKWAQYINTLASDDPEILRPAADIPYYKKVKQ